MQGPNTWPSSKSVWVVILDFAIFNVHFRCHPLDTYHFVRNCVEDGRLELEYCPTEDMVADGLTKALAPEHHWKLIKMMGIEEWNGKGVEMNGNKEQEITRMRSGSDEWASSQGSQGAKGTRNPIVG
jgi:hypothetical protein